jgi:hypothetical protein
MGMTLYEVYQEMEKQFITYTKQSSINLLYHADEITVYKRQLSTMINFMVLIKMYMEVFFKRIKLIKSSFRQ